MPTVPVESINNLYANTEVGTPADPVVMDAAIADIVATINTNWNALISTLAGNSGAHLIGSALIPGISGATTVHAQLAWIEQQIQAIQGGVVPSGSITAAMIQDLAVTYAKLSQELQASITAANKWKIEDGRPMYYNGTEWLDVDANKILVPSTTVRSGRAEVVSLQIISLEGANGKRKLIHKWTPKFDGEIIVSLDMKRSSAAKTVVFNVLTNHLGRYASGGTGAILGAVMLPLASVGQTQWDYYTPIDTITTSLIQNMNVYELAKNQSGTLDPDYITYTRYFNVFAGQTLYFVLDAPDQTGDPIFYVRNLQVKYDEVYL